MSKIGLDINHLKGLEYHYNQVKDFKKYFINNTKVSKYESYKIWASWIIAHRSLIKQEDSFLSNLNIEKDIQIIQHLQEKGCGYKQAKIFYGNVIKKCQELVEELKTTNSSKPIQINEGSSNSSTDSSVGSTREKIAIDYQSNTNDNYDYMVIKYRSIKHKISPFVYDKLKDLYMHGLTTKNFPQNLLVLLNHYNLLDGLSFQWAIPPKAFNILDKRLGIKGELFASPLNCLCKKYWSLFEVDRLFGSAGNFFDSKYEDFVGKEKEGGVYQVNPPFIENIFIQSSKCIINYLQRARDEQIGLMFIYFMPNWLDSYGYMQLKESNFLTEETVISGGTHYYYESTQQKYIKVHFNTHVLILSSNWNMSKRWTHSLKSDLKSAFKKY